MKRFLQEDDIVDLTAISTSSSSSDSETSNASNEVKFIYATTTPTTSNVNIVNETCISNYRTNSSSNSHSYNNNKEQNPTRSKSEQEGEGGQFYLTQVRELEGQTLPNVPTISLPEILASNAHHKLAYMVQINYMVDLDFIASALTNSSRNNSKNNMVDDALIIHGLRDGQLPMAVEQEWRMRYPSFRMHKQQINFQYATHHTKAMFLFYKSQSQTISGSSNGGVGCQFDKCRVVIHTANMIPGDWKSKSQGVWMSPYLKRKLLLVHGSCYESSNKKEEVVVCRFETDLIAYLRHYGQITSDLIQCLKQFDFSPIRVSFYFRDIDLAVRGSLF